MMEDWFRLGLVWSETALTAQRVIARRTARLAKGGAVAEREFRRMGIEKLAANAEACALLATGASPLKVAKR
jgi:hypothetical protein